MVDRGGALQILRLLLSFLAWCEVAFAMTYREIPVIFYLHLNRAERSVLSRIRRRVREYVLRPQILIYLSICLVQIVFVPGEERAATSFRCDLLQRPRIDAHRPADPD